MDWWIAVMLILPPIGSIGAVIEAVQTGDRDTWIAAMAAVGVVLGIYLGLVFPMRYGIDDQHLIVRHGIVRQRIALADITEVYRTRNPLSSPALSLDRLYLKFGEGFFKAAMISPVDRDQFLDELAAKAGLVRDGERRVRRT